jgi:hypothetical protein
MAVLIVSASPISRLTVIWEAHASKPNVRIGNTDHLPERVAHTGAGENVELLQRSAVFEQTSNADICYRLATEKFDASEPRAARCQLAEMRVFDGLSSVAQADCR